MNIYSVENRTRRYHPFESQLPPADKAELLSRHKRARIAPAPPPAKSNIGPWIFVAILTIILIGMVMRTPPETSQVPIAAQPSRPAVEVRRASPVRQIGQQEMITMPDGNTVSTTFKGYLGDVSQLPRHGAQAGDMWAVGNNLWVLTTPANSYKVGWVDPPDDQPEVRRALPVDNVEVRRAQMVVPRAELVQLPGN